MKNISFALTTEQILARTKTVTRRLNWLDLRKGDLLQGCKKCMGRRPGEPLERLAVVEVVAVNRERLGRMTKDLRYGRREVLAEGFPEMTPAEFVEFFCRTHTVGKKKTTPNTVITRIKFRYVEIPAVALQQDLVLT